MIVEGHMIATDCVIMTAPANVCKARRLGRRLRGTEEHAHLSAYIDEWVTPSYLQYGMPAIERLTASARSRGLLLVCIDSSDGQSVVENVATIALQLRSKADISQMSETLWNQSC